MTSPPRTSRLEKPEDAPTIEPFVRAPQIKTAALYWLGVSAWPPTFRDRLWILAFFDKLIAFAETEWNVVPLQFLTMNVAGGPIRSTLLRHSREVMPLVGAMSRPGRKPVPMPSPEEIDQASRKKITLAPERYSEDYTYWFVRGKHEQQRSLFQAYGGMTILLRAPDEGSKIKHPEVPKYMLDHPAMAKFNTIDMKSELRVAEVVSSNFGKQSKELFGEPLKEWSIFPSLPFVIPQWSSSTFFDAGAEEIKSLFSLCKIYIQESAEDKGILVAASEDLDETIIEIVHQLKVESKMEYAR